MNIIMYYIKPVNFINYYDFIVYFMLLITKVIFTGRIGEIEEGIDRETGPS